ETLSNFFQQRYGPALNSDVQHGRSDHRSHSQPPTSNLQLPSSSYSDVSRVLTRVLFLNLGVAVAKIAFGYISGAVSILSDGFHSLTDTASNVVGLIGVHAAGQPPDQDHPYGHRKYETVAASAVTVFLFLL